MKNVIHCDKFHNSYSSTSIQLNIYRVSIVISQIDEADFSHLPVALKGSALAWNSVDT